MEQPTTITNPHKADYSHIDNNEKAYNLFTKNELVKLYLMPLEFGGQESAINIVFVPAFATIQKEKFDSKIVELLENGFKLRYTAQPEYKGVSFIPSKILMTVNGDKTLNEIIEIW